MTEKKSTEATETGSPGEPDQAGYLTGQLLIAMPQMQDPRFARSVIYMCAHTGDGAMGLVLNKVIDSVSFPDLLDQLEITPSSETEGIRVHFGGPVETGRGFVLHSTDYHDEATMVIGDEMGLTADLDIVKAIADGSGPERRILALGYAGWGPGQLDEEIQENGWLSLPADRELVFGGAPSTKWEQAMGSMGIDYSKLSGSAGHA